MGKLGKKARKFARKNLQSVHRKIRKANAVRDTLRRKKISRARVAAIQDHHATSETQSSEKYCEAVVREELYEIFTNTFGADNNDDLSTDPESDSESEALLSVDVNAPHIGDVNGENSELASYANDDTAVSEKNREILVELEKHKRKLDLLLNKDPEFSNFLQSHNLELDRANEGMTLDEEHEPNQSHSQKTDGILSSVAHKGINTHIIDSWCDYIMKKQNMSVLPNILNCFETACHYGSHSSKTTIYNIQTKGAFCKILLFVLHEADGIFRRLLGMNSGCKVESVLELQKTSKWTSTKPLIKSYIKSTLELLNQATDAQTIVFILSRFRDSVIFLIVFPVLMKRFCKVVIHLWATGEGGVPLAAFLLILDMSMHFNSDCYEFFLTNMYRMFMMHCKFVEPENIKHIQFLSDSVVELYSLDIAASYQMASLHIHHLARVLQPSLKTKKKEGLAMIRDWQYLNCLEVWVKFLCTNIKEHDLGSLLYLVIQITTGVAHLLSGPRFVPMRIKCIRLLNKLSQSGDLFIPVAYFCLNMMEFGECSKSDDMIHKEFHFSSMIKVPKQILRSKHYQEECVRCVIETLSDHLAQWSYHISFPELALGPLICLRKFCSRTTRESLTHLVKPFMDQIERNIEFLQKKRDEVSFSPHDQASIDTFLQDKKRKGTAPLYKYHVSMLQKSLSKNMKNDLSISKLPDSVIVKSEHLGNGKLEGSVGVAEKLNSRSKKRKKH